MASSSERTLIGRKVRSQEMPCIDQMQGGGNDSEADVCDTGCMDTGGVQGKASG